jgi:ribonuclease HI
MRVFTDGACSSNGRPGSKAGFAVWFPEHPELKHSQRIPAGDPQTNQRAELCGIQKAVEILETNGYLDEDIVIYTDSDYSINCLTKWIPGWTARGWKTAEGKDVLHQDVIKDISSRLVKFKSHRFVHVRAHTGGVDDLSRNNDVVDRMARSTIDETVRVVEPPAMDDLYPECPLRVMGPPVAQTEVLHWIRTHLDTMDRAVIDKHLMKAFAELCKAKDITLTKQTISKTSVLRAERSNLQIDRVVVEKIE